MDRPGHFPLEADFDSDAGVAGAAPARAAWPGVRPETTEPDAADAVHVAFGRDASVLLGKVVSDPERGSGGRLAAGCYIRLMSATGAALLGFDSDLVSLIVAARFGGDPGDAALSGRAAARVMAPKLQALAEALRTHWQAAGREYVVGSPSEVEVDEWPRVLVWQAGAGSVRLSYDEMAPDRAPAPRDAGSSRRPALGLAPLAVRAVLAAPSLTLDGIARLTAGSIVPFDGGEGIALFAGERQVGQGALVDIGGRRGVRVERGAC